MIALIKNRVPLLIVVVSVLVSSCAGTLGRTMTVAPIIRPHPNAPVTVKISSLELTISNNTEGVIYHVVFPAEILPVIKWAPCLVPDRCDPELKIAPGDQKVYRLDSIANESTEELVVYWWILLENAEGGYEPPEIQEVRVPLD